MISSEHMADHCFGPEGCIFSNAKVVENRTIEENYRHMTCQLLKKGLWRIRPKLHVMTLLDINLELH